MMLRTRRRRSGATLVESALVYPVLFLIIFATVMLGVAVFRYQQVAHMAREGARWASVHGARYSQENPTGTPGTPQNIYTYGVKPAAAGLNIKQSDVTVTWNENNRTSTNFVVLDPATGQSTVKVKQNYVSVTVKYSWNTGLFGTIPVSSTSIMPINY
jgi:Flp pilus assembly protein TadG